MEINSEQYSALSLSSRHHKREQRVDFQQAYFFSVPIEGVAVTRRADEETSLARADAFVGPNPPMFGATANGFARRFEFQNQLREKRRQDKEK